MSDGYPVFITEACDGCNLCVEACPMVSLQVDPKTKVVSYADKDSCIFCGHCAAICPTRAISMFGIMPKDEESLLEKDAPAVRAIKMVRTHRMYKPEPLTKEELMKVLSIAKYSSSASNIRPLHFTVLSRNIMNIIGDSIAKEIAKNPKYAKLSTKIENGTDVVFRGAPHMILMSAPANLVESAVADASIAGRDIELHAESLGYGMFWCGFLLAAVAKSEEIYKACGVPQGHKIVMAMGIGRPSTKFARPALRRDLQEGVDITFK